MGVTEELKVRGLKKNNTIFFPWSFLVEGPVQYQKKHVPCFLMVLMSLGWFENSCRIFSWVFWFVPSRCISAVALFKVEVRLEVGKTRDVSTVARNPSSHHACFLRFRWKVPVTYDHIIDR